MSVGRDGRYIQDEGYDQYVPAVDSGWGMADPYVYDEFSGNVNPPPDRSKFKTKEEYQKALKAWVAERNGPQAFEPNRPIEAPPGATGNWRAAGTNRKERVGEYWADQMNSKWFESNGGGSMNTMAIASWIANNPDKAQAAYMAVRGNGEPMLDPGLMAYFEQQGITPWGRDPEYVMGEGGKQYRPEEGWEWVDDMLKENYQTPKGELPEPPSVDRSWTQKRLGTWNDTYLDEVGAGTAGGGSVNIYDGDLTDNWDRLRAGIPDLTQEQYIAHITDFLTKNGYTISSDGTIRQTALDPNQNPNLEGPAVDGGNPRDESSAMSASVDLDDDDEREIMANPQMYPPEIFGPMLQRRKRIAMAPPTPIGYGYAR